MTSFVYDSVEFQSKLAENAHAGGEVRFLESVLRPGMNVLELGANKGVVTLAAARSVGETGHVYAFEPIPEYYAALKENLRVNSVKNVTCYQSAVTATVGEIPMYKHGEGTGIVPEDGAERLVVESTTVDEFARAGVLRVDLLVMDCEGSELFVLREARETLRKDRPQIFCEIHRSYLESLGQTVANIVDYLKKLEFEVRPVFVDDLDKKVNFAQCSHIYAAAATEPFPDTSC